MSDVQPSVQLEEVRRRARSLLCSAQDVKAVVQTMAGLPLPPSDKYRHLPADAMLRENTAVRSRQEVKAPAGFMC